VNGLERMARLGIIIPSYNDSSRLESGIRSILQLIKYADFQIVIVDNASEKQSVKDYLQKLNGDKNIHVIRNDKNLGYAKAVNQGISFLRSNGNPQFVIVMNQDIQILTDNLEEILGIMEKEDRWGICGPRLFNADGTIQNSGYAFPSIHKKIAQFFGLQKLGFTVLKFFPRSIPALIPRFASSFLMNYADVNDPIEIPWLQGAFLIIKGAVFEDTMGFDENFRFYAEDMDFCKRAKDKGWKSYCFPELHVLHSGGYKPEERSRELTEIYFESLLYYYTKHFRGIRQKIMLFLNAIERGMKMRLATKDNRGSPSDMDKISFAGIEIDNLSFREALQKIRAMIESNKRGYIVTPNAQHINLLQDDEEFKKSYEDACLVLADGMSVIFALRVLGTPVKERCAGSDMFQKIIHLAAELNKNIFILGGTEGSEKIAFRKIKQMHPNLKVYYYSPPFDFEKNEEENQKILKAINASDAEILFMCVGTPKSEKWLYRYFSHLKTHLAFVFGDSLNFFAGIKQRAPKWLQKMGLEWLFRLIQEPRRLWRRYLIGNAQFIVLSIREMSRKYLKI